MTKIIHIPIENEFVGHGTNNELLITNRQGSFIYLPTNQNSSKYHGVFYYDTDKMDAIKTINQFKRDHKDEITIKNLRPYRSNEEIYYFKNFIVYRGPGIVTLNLDVRYIYDFESWGRYYNITFPQENTIIIEYIRNDFRFYLALYSNNFKHEKIEEWVRESYETDRERNSPPFEQHTFDALKLDLSDDLLIGLGKTIDEARIALEQGKQNKKQLIKTKQNYLEKLSNKVPDSRINQGLNLAVNALDLLTIDTDDFGGVFAGLPWFFQFWTRDEAISIGGLLAQKKYSLVKKILLRHINNTIYDGRIANRFPKSELGSADGTGLSYLRLYQLILKLSDTKELKKYFNLEEVRTVRNLLDASITKLSGNYLKKGLIYNAPKETWMDTDETITDYKDTREGYCIEIQALFATMLEFREYLYKILGEKCNRESEEFIKLVRSKFLSEKTIVDRLNPNLEVDQTTRPNIFLAYYINKKLFTDKIWIQNFKSALKELWLDWGGLSSISKDSNLFCKNYTGQNNHSYHRGDSWFFVNNIAAISMIKLSKKEFSDYIRKIIEASTRDILFEGIIGHSSELSDAEFQSSRASLSQAWSSATYIELISIDQPGH